MAPITPIRIQLRRSKGWRLPPGTVVVSRPTKWGNPYTVGTSASFFAKSVSVPDAATAVKLFRAYAQIPINGVSLAEQARQELRGKDLACWCPAGQACHGDVLLQFANGPERDLI